MYATIALTTLLAAAGALAAPAQDLAARQIGRPNSIIVTLERGPRPDVGQSAPLLRTFDFTGSDVSGRSIDLAGTGEAFEKVTLTIGSGVANKDLRCQVRGPDGNVLRVDRGTNVNKLTFGDAGKGAWQLDARGDKISRVDRIQCDRAFKNE